MAKKKLVNLLLVIIALLLVAVFGLSVRLVPSADRIAIFKAEGIACSKCAAVLVGTLEAERGVASAAVDESSGRVVVSYNSRTVSPNALERCIAAKGFGCRQLQVQTVGEYRASGAGIPPRHTKPCCCAGDSKSKS